MAHDWQGNIRELENVIERTFILCNEGVIGIGHLPEELTVHGSSRVSDSNIKMARNLLEIQTIQKTLEKNAYNRLTAARELGIHKSTLFRKMKRLSISLPCKDGRSKGRHK